MEKTSNLDDSPRVSRPCEWLLRFEQGVQSGTRRSRPPTEGYQRQERDAVCVWCVGTKRETYIRIAIISPLVQSLHRIPNAHTGLLTGPEVVSRTEVERHSLLCVLLGVEGPHSVTSVRIITEDLGLGLGAAGGGGGR